MKYLLLAVIALATVSCAAPTRWEKLGATTAEFDSDKLRCKYEASLATANTSNGYHGASGALASGIEASIKSDDLTTMCMRARGWYLQPG